MSWGFLGPITIRFGRNGGSLTFFGAWLSVIPLASWWLSCAPVDPPDHASNRLESDKEMWEGSVSDAERSRRGV